MLNNSVLKTSKKVLVIALSFLLIFQSFFIADISRVEAASPEIEPIQGDEWITDSKWLRSENIKGDLYIGPEAVVTINGNVTVEGNIYVLGALVSYGTLNVRGSINARQFSWSVGGAPGSLYNGTVQLRGGTNNIRSQNASNKPLTNIPFNIYTEPIKAENGIINNIKGATIPVGDFKVEGKEVVLNSNGTFETGELDIGNKDTLTFTFTDVFNNTITKKFPVQQIDTIPPTVQINKRSAYLTNPEDIALTISEPGNIYYTTDGSEPTVNSKVYSEAIKIEDNADLKYLAIDNAGNKSEIYSETYMFLSINELSDKDKVVTGKAYPETTVNVVVGDKTYSGKATTDGIFQIDVNTLSEFQKVKVSATSDLGLNSEVVEISILDTTPPKQPTINEVTDQSKVLEGQAEANSTVIIKVEGKEIASGKANSEGNYSISIPVQKADAVVKVTATDLAGNTSEKVETIVIDITAPEKPVVNPITNYTTEITGTAEANSKIIIKKDDKVLGTSNTDKNGNFTLKIIKQKTGESIAFTATDKAGNESERTTIKVTEVLPPNKPVVNKITDKSEIIEGTGDAGSTVVVETDKKEIGRAEVSKNGKFNIKLKNKLKANTELTIFATNEYDKNSENVIVKVKDVTAPEKPKVNEVGNLSTAITGKAEAFSLVEVKVNNKVIGKAEANKSGKFNITINTQKKGTKLSITATDAAGNISNSNIIEIFDSKIREKKVSKLGHISSGLSSIYISPDSDTGKISSDQYKNSVYYIKKEATYKGELFYLLSNNASVTKGTIGWMKASQVSTHTHKGVDSNNKKLYLKGTKGSSYSRAWGGKKNEVYPDLSKYSNQEFKVNKTEKVGRNTWYRGELNGKETFIHSSYLYALDKSYEEKSVSLLGHIKKGKSDLYGSPANLSDKESSDKYKNSVYYIKKEAAYKGNKYYLLSNNPSATKGTIGWMNAKDLSTHTHKGVSKKKQTLYIQGIDKGFSKAWGGSKDVSIKDLPKKQPTKFEVDLIEKVGRNTWYRGQVEGKRTWVHSSKVTKKEETNTSLLAHLRSSDVQIHKELGNIKTASKAGPERTNQVYYIKKQAKLGKETYYLIATSPSSTKNVIGWVNLKDLSTHTHKGIDKKTKNLTIKGSGTSYTKAWGGKRNIVNKDLSELKNKSFKINLTERVGNNVWYRGNINGKQMWIHNSYVK